MFVIMQLVESICANSAVFKPTLGTSCESELHRCKHREEIVFTAEHKETFQHHFTRSLLHPRSTGHKHLLPVFSLRVGGRATKFALRPFPYIPTALTTDDSELTDWLHEEKMNQS